MFVLATALCIGTPTDCQNGVCNANTGICECQTGYMGTNCDQGKQDWKFILYFSFVVAIFR